MTKIKSNNKVKLQKVELLWKEKEYYNSTNLNKNIYILEDFLESINPNVKEIE